MRPRRSIATAVGACATLGALLVALAACGGDASGADDLEVGASADAGASDDTARLDDAAADPQADSTADLAGDPGAGTDPAADGGPQPGRSATRAVADFDRPVSAYDAPFPDITAADALADGTLVFPNPGNNAFVAAVVETALSRRAFGQSSPIMFPFDGGIDVASLPPDVHASVEPGATVFVVDVDARSPEQGSRRPVDVSFRADGGPYGADNALVVIPHPGFPLRPSTRYAAVVTTGVRGDDDLPLAAASLDGDGPAFDARRAAAALTGIALDQIAALAVFDTGDATARMAAAVHDALDAPIETVDAPVLHEVFERFCVYRGRVSVPVYQQGTPPYDGGGGGWAYEDASVAMQRREEANVWITLPRVAPRASYDTVVFIRTGGGGDRPLIDRGLRTVALGPTEPGTGPANELANAGWAAVSVDGPHGGLRNVTGRDEQLLMFNIQNPPAMRDNIRQSALELAMLPAWLDTVELPRDVCPPPGPAPTPRPEPGPGPATARLDRRLVLMGHSMGATIAPLVVAAQPRFEALILSGAGGSWIENVVHKQSPLPVRPLAELILRYRSGELRRDDPVLGLLQWGGEVADPPLYAATAPPALHVLMFQGIVDTYILPPIANALSLSFGLDLLGEPVDATDARLSAFAPLQPLLALGGRGVVYGSANANGAGGATRVLVQHAQDAIEDGHEVMFQLDLARRQYTRFLETLERGAPYASEEP